MERFERLSTHRYFTSPPGALSTLGPRTGFLLRFEWNHQFGYADLMAWPELGDLTLEEELWCLLRDQPTALGTAAIQMAWRDAQARSQGHSLWKNLPNPPRSHYLAGSLEDLSELHYPTLVARGFRSIKVKWPKNIALSHAVRILLDQLNGIQEHGLQLRVDFNGAMSGDALLELLSPIPTERCSAFDFFEDPFPKENLEDWLTFKKHFPNLDLFVDRATPSDLDLLHLADGWILKPALQNIEWLRPSFSRKKISFTHYLGHPLGAAWAAWFSTREKTVDSGLLFSSKIEGDSDFFSKSIQSESCFFPTEHLRLGEGIGWTDSHFEKLTWSPWR